MAIKNTPLIGLLLPTLIASVEASRLMRVPSGAEIPQQVADATARLQNELQIPGPDTTAAVQLAVESERQRLAGLESKGFAVAAFPLAVVATSAALIGKNASTTTFSFIAIAYAVFALISAGQIVNPGARASFVVADAQQPDWLARLAATTEVNRTISISVQNRVYAALMDTVRGAGAVAIATTLLLVNAAGGHSSRLPQPSGANTVSSAVTPAPSSTTPAQPRPARTTPVSRPGTTSSGIRTP